jgi:hypothetical protein
VNGLHDGDFAASYQFPVTSSKAIWANSRNLPFELEN